MPKSVSELPISWKKTFGKPKKKEKNGSPKYGGPFCRLMWSIWRERNARIFEGKAW